MLLLLLKESLNNDGRQYQQYQESAQSPLVLTEPTEHNMTPMCRWKSTYV